MAHRSLTLFVICIGITVLLKISHHVCESSVSSTKSSIDSPVRKNDKLMDTNDFTISSAQPPVNKRKRSSILRSGNSMDDPNLITSSRFDSSLEHFFDKMEVLSAHIDRLHERYMRLNELNDDYISREFSVESPLKDDNAD